MLPRSVGSLGGQRGLLHLCVGLAEQGAVGLARQPERIFCALAGFDRAGERRLHLGVLCLLSRVRAAHGVRGGRSRARWQWRLCPVVRRLCLLRGVGLLREVCGVGLLGLLRGVSLLREVRGVGLPAVLCLLPWVRAGCVSGGGRIDGGGGGVCASGGGGGRPSATKFRGRAVSTKKHTHTRACARAHTHCQPVVQ